MSDSSNKLLVGGSTDGTIQILNLPMKARTSPGGGALPLWPAPAPLRPDEAINLAAWLVALSGRRAAFLRLLDEIERS